MRGLRESTDGAQLLVSSEICCPEVHPTNLAKEKFSIDFINPKHRLYSWRLSMEPSLRGYLRKARVPNRERSKVQGSVMKKGRLYWVQDRWRRLHNSHRTSSSTDL